MRFSVTLAAGLLCCALFANLADAANIIAHYGFESDVVTDDSSNGHTLVNSGGVVQSPLGTSAFGNRAAQFSGGNFLYSPDVAPFNFGTGPFAIGFWYLRIDESTGVLVSKGDSGGAAEDPFSGYVAHLHPPNNDPEFRFYFENDMGAGVSQVATEIDWRHYVVQRDADGLVRSYAQGGGVNLVETTNFADVSSLSMAFAIGAGTVSTTGAGAANHFTGFIDDVWVFDNALTDTQVNNLFNFNAVPEPSTIALLASGLVLSAGALLRRSRQRRQFCGAGQASHAPRQC